MPVTMTQVAKEVGVSVGVVSRLLRDDPTLSISDQRRQQILDAVDRLGGIEARPRKRQQTRVILVPTADTRSPDWLQRNVLTGERWGMFKKTIEKAGFSAHVTFYSEAEKYDVFKRIITAGRQCDGLLLLDSNITSDIAQLLWAEAFPHVGFSVADEELGLNTVHANLEQGIRQGISYLAELGHRYFGFIGPRANSTYPKYVAALANCHLPIDETNTVLMPALPDDADQVQWYERTYEYATRWLQEGWPKSQVTALMAQDDRGASAIIQAMVDLGLKPGEDLSVLGCGNQLSKDIHPDGKPACGITTVENPFGRIGKRAAELLLNQILHDQTRIVHERLPARLVIRESTGQASPRFAKYGR